MWKASLTELSGGQRYESSSASSPTSLIRLLSQISHRPFAHHGSAALQASTDVHSRRDCEFFPLVARAEADSFFDQDAALDLSHSKLAPSCPPPPSPQLTFPILSHYSREHRSPLPHPVQGLAIHRRLTQGRPLQQRQRFVLFPPSFCYLLTLNFCSTVLFRARFRDGTSIVERTAQRSASALYNKENGSATAGAGGKGARASKGAVRANGSAASVLTEA